MSALTKSSPLRSLLARTRASNDISLQLPSLFPLGSPDNSRHYLRSHLRCTLHRLNDHHRNIIFLLPAAHTSTHSTSQLFVKRLSLPIPLCAQRMRPRSAKYITDNPHLRWLTPRRIQSHSRNARGSPRAYVPRAHSPPLQFGLRCQFRLLRVHTAERRRITLRHSHQHRDSPARSRKMMRAVRAFRAEFVALKEGGSSVFVALESVYSMY